MGQTIELMVGKIRLETHPNTLRVLILPSSDGSALSCGFIIGFDLYLLGKTPFDVCLKCLRQESSFDWISFTIPMDDILPLF